MAEREGTKKRVDLRTDPGLETQWQKKVFPFKKNDRSTATRFGEFLPFWYILATLKGRIWMCQNFWLTWANYIFYWANFRYCEWPKHWTNSLVIWSHWSRENAQRITKNDCSNKKMIKRYQNGGNWKAEGSSVNR